MPGIDGGMLRAWRRARGWDVPEVARQLRHAAREAGVHVAAPAGLVRMIYAWERGDHELSARYELLYRALGFVPPTASWPADPHWARVVTPAEVTGPEAASRSSQGRHADAALLF